MKFKCCRPLSIILSAAAALALLAAAPADAENAEKSSAGDAALFQRLDANRDGVVRADEVPSEHERLIKRLFWRGDSNGDRALSEKEFLNALTPSRPEKPIEQKQPVDFPQADAVRYLLLSLDTSGNRLIDADEVPERLEPVFEAMLERLDVNENGRLEPAELNRGGGRLAQIAARYVARDEIDVAAELKKLEKAQGKSASRFEEQRPAVDMLADPKQARPLFARLDANGDGQLEPSEAPEPAQPQIERLMRVADRDRNGQLSEREFLAAADRISRFKSRRDRPMPAADRLPKGGSAKDPE